ncbi:MAG TPA: hypothetical protein VG796_27005 [Verrucomicrobiales bacterium]|jgi:hypothetical protein|nr:hypothetical protein [Verrucomicrobiales bacterium]
MLTIIERLAAVWKSLKPTPSTWVLGTLIPAGLLLVIPTLREALINWVLLKLGLPQMQTWTANALGITLIILALVFVIVHEKTKPKPPPAKFKYTQNPDGSWGVEIEADPEKIEAILSKLQNAAALRKKGIPVTPIKPKRPFLVKLLLAEACFLGLVLIYRRLFP